MTERMFLRLEGDPLYAPETSVPAGAMREHCVDARLREVVSHVAVYREVIPDGAEVLERVLPDGAARLIFNLGDAPSATGRPGLAVEVAGASAAPALLRLRGRIEGVSVTLRPGTAAAVLGVPAGEIAEQALALDEIWGPEATELRERLSAARTDAARVARVQDALWRRLRTDDRDLRRRARAGVRLFAESAGRSSVRDVSDALGVGERRLQQIFHAEVGLSPRVWRRLARMHACLRALRAIPAPRWSEVALDGGFYDQSHLIHEFQSLCGLSPAHFLERAVSGSSKTAGRGRDSFET